MVFSYFVTAVHDPVMLRRAARFFRVLSNVSIVGVAGFLLVLHDAVTAAVLIGSAFTSDLARGQLASRATNIEWLRSFDKTTRDG